MSDSEKAREIMTRRGRLNPNPVDSYTSYSSDEFRRVISEFAAALEEARREGREDDRAQRRSAMPSDSEKAREIREALCKHMASREGHWDDWFDKNVAAALEEAKLERDEFHAGLHEASRKAGLARSVDEAALRARVEELEGILASTTDRLNTALREANLSEQVGSDYSRSFSIRNSIVTLYEWGMKRQVESAALRARVEELEAERDEEQEAKAKAYLSLEATSRENAAWRARWAAALPVLMQVASPERYRIEREHPLPKEEQ